MTRNRLGIAIYLILVAGLSWLVANQGCRNRLANVDLLTMIDDACRLVSTGEMPEKGCISSLRAFIPPGTTWLLLPGVLTCGVHGCELPGTALLHAGTVLGVFLLSQRVFGTGTALLAVFLYAFTPVGFQFSFSLWPRGHPFFVIWFVYFLLLWMTTRRGPYLSCAMVVLAVGLYVFLELAPFGMVLLGALGCCRRSISWAWLGGGAVVALVVWWPYLHFEYQRGFCDLRSQILRQGLDTPVLEVPTDRVVTFASVEENVKTGGSNTAYSKSTFLDGFPHLRVLIEPMRSNFDFSLHRMMTPTRRSGALSYIPLMLCVLPVVVFFTQISLPLERKLLEFATRARSRPRLTAYAGLALTAIGLLGFQLEFAAKG